MHKIRDISQNKVEVKEKPISHSIYIFFTVQKDRKPFAFETQTRH